MTVKRFKRDFRCPICDGFNSQRRGVGKRCHGFLSDDKEWVHCAREEFSGGIPMTPGKSKTYAHKLYGNCNCGTQHNPPLEGLTTRPNARSIKNMKTKIIDTYDYSDEHGGLLYQVCRVEPKGFFQRRPDGNGGWMNSTAGVQRVLYRLPELLASDTGATVFICEGEKDVDALRKLGLVATTNAGGAEKWQDVYNEQLRGRHIVILPDNDEPGQKHAGQVARSLSGVAASMKVLNLPGLPEKGDVSDWLKAGGTGEQLQNLVVSTKAFKSADSTAENYGEKVLIQSAADLLAREFPEPKYAIYGLLSEGVTIFAGKPKLGKSWLCLGIAIAVASGSRVLSSIPVQQGDVLYLALEDGERRLQNRLETVLGKDTVSRRLEYATSFPRFNEGGLEAIEAWLKAHPDARLIVIDTLKRVRPKETRLSRLYDLDYESIAPLADLSKKYGVSILVVHHSRKDDSDDPLDLISGSTGLTGAVDGALVLKRTRGQSDAVLHSVGRDFEDRELALLWENRICNWSLLGNAEEFQLSKERKEIIDLLQLQKTLTPKETAQMLHRKEGATRKLMLMMAKDGQLHNDGSGRYSLPVAVNSSNFGNSSNPTLFSNSGNSELQGNSFQSYPAGPLFGNSVNPSNDNGLDAGVTTVTTTVVPVMSRSKLPADEYWRVNEEDEAA